MARRYKVEYTFEKLDGTKVIFGQITRQTIYINMAVNIEDKTEWIADIVCHSDKKPKVSRKLLDNILKGIENLYEVKD